MKRQIVSLACMAGSLLWAQVLLGQPRPQQERRRPPLIDALDLDGDGILSKEEIAKAPDSLKKMDRNGDGRIDRQELRTISRRPASSRLESEPLQKAPAKLTAGIHRIGIEHDGLARGIIIHLPSDYDSKKRYPVVFGFHGAGGPMEGFHRRLSPFVEKSEFISVSPQGLADNPRGTTGFNAFPRCTISKADDVGLVRKIVEYLDESASIDHDRLYATGGSNGGIFCYRLAMETNLFAAIAPQRAGMLKRQGVPKDRPILSILHVHGIDDESLPIKGGSAARDEVFYSAEETLSAWANNHGSKGEKRTEELEKKIQLSKFADKDAPYELNLCVLEGYGHRFDRVITTKVDNMIWDFFQRHRKTGGKKNK